MLRISILLLSLTLLTGCLKPPDDRPTSNYNPKAGYKNEVYQIRYKSNATQLLARQQNAVKVALDHKRHIKAVTLSPCHDDSNQQNQNQRMQYLKNFIEMQGYVANTSTENFKAAPEGVQCVNMKLKRLVVVLPNCNNLSDKSTMEHTRENFGCTLKRNLGMMIADPHDLLPSNTAAPEFNGVRSNRSTNQYLNAEQPTKQQSTKEVGLDI